jgi:hypothetical protein
MSEVDPEISDPNANVTVSGHIDNVSLAFIARFLSKWVRSANSFCCCRLPSQ